MIKKLRNFKKVYIVLMIFLLTFSVTGCKKNKRNSDVNYNNINKNHIKGSYTVYVINSEKGLMKKNLLKGYKDALTDLFGKKHFKLKFFDVDENSSSFPDSVKKSNLILANGKIALEKSVNYSSQIPVVATGILNFQSVLKTENTGLLNPTGINITGTSTISPMSNVMSLIIESVGDLKSVGLLYSPEDDNAIYQNEVLESFMNSAGIRWKEYELASTKTTEDKNSDSNGENANKKNVDNKNNNEKSLTNKSTDDVTQNDENTAVVIDPITPTLQSSFSRSFNSIDNIGEKSLIETPFSPTSARAPKISKNWDIQSASNPSILEGATNEDVLNCAISECSVLFIPSGSNIKDQLNLITKASDNAAIPTITNDSLISDKTFTCLYTDPYAFGYSAGKQTYRILIKKEKAKDMAIESISPSVTVKLYNKSLSKKYNRVFPKSFFEVNSYLKESVPGVTVKRINKKKI